MTDRLCSPQELAEFLNLPVRTIYAWRSTGAGPQGVKVGRHVRYRQSDIDAWLAARVDPRTAA